MKDLSLFELDAGDEAVLDDLQKRVDAAINDFLTSEIVVDTRRRAAMALMVIAVRAAIIEIRCDQEGLDESTRRDILFTALGSATQQLAQTHVAQGCRRRDCDHVEDLRRVSQQIALRYEDLRERAKTQRVGTADATSSTASRRRKTPARRGR